MNFSRKPLGLLATATLIGATLLASCAADRRRSVRPVNLPGWPADALYSQAVIANGFLHVSGVVAIDRATGAAVAGGIRPQTQQVFETLATILKTAGASFDDVVKVNIYLKDPADVAAVNAIYAGYFAAHKPARTTVPGADWPAGILIEVDLVAVAPEP